MHTNAIASGWVAYLNDAGDQISSLGPEALVVAACLVVGYVLRTIRKIPNEVIPPSVIIIGTAVYPFLADTAQGRNADFKNAIVGMTLGFLSWTFHNKILKRVEDKIPFLKELLEGGDDPAKPQ